MISRRWLPTIASTSSRSVARRLRVPNNAQPRPPLLLLVVVRDVSTLLHSDAATLVTSYPSSISRHCSQLSCHRPFSTSENAQTTGSQGKGSEKKDSKTVSFPSAMRNMVKPFFMKCHPDVQSSPSAKDINLAAIQNLNAFLDSVAAQTKPGADTGRPRRNQKTVFEIDFCVMMEERIKGKKEEILCRRSVELTLPTQQQQQQQPKASPEKKRLDFQSHVENQLVKLLHIAGLKAPAVSSVHYQERTNLEEDVERAWEQMLQDGDFSRLSPAQIRFARQQRYNRNRDAFTSKINWKRYDQVYKETVRDIQADWATEGLIRDDPQRRLAYLAEILSRIRIEESEEGESGANQVDPIMQLIALRRLSLLLDENFDDLHLEDLGRMWENAVIVLTPARSYNTSPSALYRRRKRQTKGDVMANDGFAFALHHDNSVTIRVPVDFRDEELLSQLKRHVKDYYSLIDIGLEGIFPVSARSNDL